MKKAKLIFNSLWALVMVATVSFLVSCGGDEEAAVELTIVSLNAGDDDLNGVTSPTGVSTTTIITGVFSTHIDPATASSNVTLVSDFDDTEVEVTVVADGRALKITPNEELFGGSLYILTIKAGLTSTKGKTLGTDLTRSFSTVGTFTPANVVAHWNFEDNADDQVGDYSATATDIVDITYVDSRKTAAGKAASFNGTTSLIEIPNGDDFLGNDDFTLSFWVKANSSKNGQFVLGLAAWKGFQFEIAGDWGWVKLASQYSLSTGGTNSEDNFFNGDGKTKDNGGYVGWTFHKTVTGVGDIYFKDKWANVVCTYDSQTKIATMYINGDMVKQHDFNLFDNEKVNFEGVAYAGNAAPGNKFALGFIQARENRIITDSWADYSNPENNHFKGLLDDVRIFSVAITAEEAKLMYDSEK
ncbi:MAG: LamG-like jellyroll fold domain-containing protein [Imperialibacter sp.]